MNTNRVVISGYGAVTPFGDSANALFNGLKNKQNTTKIMNDWRWLKNLNSLVASPALDIEDKWIPRKFRRSMSKMSKYAVKASLEALAFANISNESITKYNPACLIGSTIGSSETIHNAYKHIVNTESVSGINSMTFFKTMSHAVASNVAQFLNLGGMTLGTSAACASSLMSIGLGYQMIKGGFQKMVICGGAEELHPTVTASFDILEGTSINFHNSPSKTPRPFDKDRDGLVCSEGAGILILEDYEHAKKRNAPIFAEIIGFHSNSSNSSISQSTESSLVDCMHQCLKNAQVSPSEIDYINAHATGTIYGDKTEAAAIRHIFSDKINVSSLKGYFGHTLGASGAIELIASIHMINENIIYPGLNLDNIADDCNKIGHFFEQKKLDVNTILKNSFAFGGINASVILRSKGS